MDKTFVNYTSPNGTERFVNSTLENIDLHHGNIYLHHGNIINIISVQCIFTMFYSVIFVVGLFGNVLVCFVVLSNKAMQTVTNIFICNLALSDILLCIFAVPLTPLYSFRGTWSLGTVMCHVMPLAQGSSVYISTFTLMSIAVDRFFVIIYPFRPRMRVKTCITVIILIWTFALTVTTPYAIFMRHYDIGTQDKFCDEMWPSEKMRRIFGSITSVLQFVLPFLVIAFCYTCVNLKLNERTRAKAAIRNSRNGEFDKNRHRKTNQMLIAMVTIFGLSWLPLNAINLFNDYYFNANLLKYFNFLFFICHVIAMSSTCYNPFVYAWMNEQFRKEFKQLMPCIDPSTNMRVNLEMEREGGNAEQTNNGGTTTTTDTSLGSSSQTTSSSSYNRKPSAAADVEHSGVELDEDLLNVDVKHCHISTSYNLRRESVKLRLINEESFDGKPAQTQF